MTRELHSSEEKSVISAMREQIDATTMPLSPARSRPSYARHPRLLGATAAVVLAVVASIFLLSSTATTPPAFAAAYDPNGFLSITLRDLSSVNALNAKLTQMGTRVQVSPVQPGCVAPVRAVNAAGVLGPPRTIEVPRVRGIVSLTIKPDVTRPGRTLVIGGSRDGLEAFVTIVAGGAPSCVSYVPPGAAKPFLLPAQ